MTAPNAPAYEGFAIVELLGHRRLAGYVRETQLAGAGLLRIELAVGDQTVTQFVNPSSLYALTPCTEEIAREIARQAPAPVSKWDLRALLPKPEPTVESTWDDDDEYS